LKNTQYHYGWITITLHWVSAILIIGLFILGVWMVDLDYYHSWRKAAPELHQSVGLTLFLVMLLRLIWRTMQTQPCPLKSHQHYEIQLAKLVHALLYLLIFLIMISGTLFATADGREIEYFQQWMIPGFGSLFDDQEEKAGLFHQYAAYSLIFFVVLHALAALKHHFVNKDITLLRMLGKKTNF